VRLPSSSKRASGVEDFYIDTGADWQRHGSVDARLWQYHRRHATACRKGRKPNVRKRRR
jgi:hypothetical protein